MIKETMKIQVMARYLHIYLHKSTVEYLSLLIKSRHVCVSMEHKTQFPVRTLFKDSPSRRFRTHYACVYELIPTQYGNMYQFLPIRD